MEVYERIKQRREELRLSTLDVARALKVARSTIHRYESAEIKNVGLDKVEALARVLKTTPAWLMGWNDNPSVYNKDADETTNTSLPSALSTKQNAGRISLSIDNKTVIELIFKYLNLDTRGQEAVDTVLTLETIRMLNNSNANIDIAIPIPIPIPIPKDTDPLLIEQNEKKDSENLFFTPLTKDEPATVKDQLNNDIARGSENPQHMRREDTSNDQ